MLRLIIFSLVIFYSICDEFKNEIVFGETCGTTDWIQKGESDEYDTAECIEATEDSCVNSLLVDFVPGTVEANVYYQVLSDEANLKISILDENDSLVVSYEYNKNKHIDGWSHISIPVERNFSGYVKLQGSSFSSDTILVDSIQFIANDTLVNQANTESEILKQNIQQKGTDEDLIHKLFVFNDRDLNLEPEYDNDFDYGSESVEDDGSVPDYDTKLKNIENNIDLEQNSQQIQEQNLQQIQEQKLDIGSNIDAERVAEEELSPESVNKPDNTIKAENRREYSPEVELQPKLELELEQDKIQTELELPSDAERGPNADVGLEPHQHPGLELQAEPGLELESKPAEKPELKPAEIKTELESESNIQPELEPVPETKTASEAFLDHEPERELEPEPEFVLEPEPEVESELEPEIEPEPKAEQELQLELESRVEQEPELESELEPELEPELDSELEPKLEPELDSGLEPELEPKPKVEQEPEIEPDLESEQEREVDFEPQAEPEPELEPELDFELEGELEHDLEPELEFEPQAKPEPEIEPESGVELELEPELEAAKLELEPEVGSEPELEPILGFRYRPELKFERESDLLYDSSGFWNVWTISLVVLGLAVVVSITAVSAYHCGKLGRHESILLVDEEEEPRNIIPRVKKAYHNPAYHV